MSTVYYIRNKKKYEEVKKLEKFWDNLVKKTKKSIEDFCRKTDGIIVNADLAEDIIDDKFGRFSYAPIYPIYESGYDTDIASFNHSTGLIFRNQYVGDNYDICIRSVKDLQDFFNSPESENCIIVDEYSKPVTMDEFVEMDKKSAEIRRKNGYR